MAKGKKNKGKKGKGKAKNNPSTERTTTEQQDPAPKKAGRPPVPLPEYIRDIFLYDEETDKYQCLICSKDDKKEKGNQENQRQEESQEGILLERKNINRHLLENETHRRKTPEKDLPHLEKVIADIKTNRENSEKKLKHSEKTIHKRNYLRFIAFCAKENFSFEQIKALGNFLSFMAKENSLGFLKTERFNEEQISKLCNELGNFLLEDLKSDLMTTNYSLSLDNVTFGGQSICGLKVRYIKQVEEKIKGTLNQEALIKKSQIKNKVIGIKYIGGTSSAEAMLDIVREKVFALDPKLKENLIGYVHDAGPNLSGPHRGAWCFTCKRSTTEMY
jgi:hypothetical protein